MNRKGWIFPILVVMGFSLVGCSGNNRSGVNERYTDYTRPIGYYSNENHPKQTPEIFNDNDGPVTEFMDHTMGAEGKIAHNQRNRMLQTRDENGNPLNPTVPLANEDQSFFKHDNRYSMSDANYNGHLHQNEGGFSADPATLGKLSDRIRSKAASVKNVRDVRSVVYGSSVLISVNLIDNSQAKNTKKEIKAAVKPYANGKSVTVITDEGTLSRNRTIKNDLREGGAQ
ncbi:MAG: YhcN/YlaJ family sporulation lipoprotein [Bacillota bacterium]|nr:YhcN/YlaJ family sporulation lipoprotein [Bacillota bacterium]